MPKNFRCVITSKHPDGKSFVSEIKEVPVGPLGIIDFWGTDRSPAPLFDENPLKGKPIRLEPPTQGTLFRFFEIPPAQDITPEQAEQAFASVGAAHCRVDTRKNSMMHTTRTIDYVVILQGEVTLLLDDGEVKLKPFDAVVQKGTNHYWINHGKEPALLMGVLLDAEKT